MQGYIGYTRVSTVKQGTKGVSLLEQRDAILRYAERNQFPISTWLEEMETAATQGRPVFNQALKLLRTGRARGIILHKLDRGARNLRDWAAIGELADQGVEVHFVNESLDLNSRGGRLSADIQAVVAADYIRNLREETRKGLYGRLKQGIWPLQAPLGYANQGSGKPKTIDPVMGPLAKKAFELYGTARYSLETLGEEMYRLGLRNASGGRVTRTGLSTLLNNPFYIGIIRLKKTGEAFPGIHEPLIGKALFDRVKAVLTGKMNVQNQRHSFQFRRMLTCAVCGYSLIGERQKGHVYYRCHSEQCAGTSIREETVAAEVECLLKAIRFSAEEKVCFKAKILQLRGTWQSQKEDEKRSLNLQLSQIKDRLNRLADAYLDHTFDKTMFEERKLGLLLQQKTVEENLGNLSRVNGSMPDMLEKFLELAGNAWLSHQMALPEEQREMIRIVTSNRQVRGKQLDLKPSLPFEEVANRFSYRDCGLERTVPRTCDRLLNKLTALIERGQLSDLSAVFGGRMNDTESPGKPVFPRH
jgi:site-specific DNA recombinase